MKTILLVDDCEDLLSIMVIVLSDPNIKLHTASSGVEALKKIEELPIDLVITDLDMFDGSGQWLLSETRRLLNPPPVVVMSGNSMVTQSEVLALGARAYISKPSELGPVLEIINELLDIGL